MAHMNEAAIDVSDVHKTCKGRVHALRGVTMRVERGEVFGLLGPTALEKARWSRS
jgi:ABC-type multidrug transport system ATPase subunit